MTDDRLAQLLRSWLLHDAQVPGLRAIARDSGLTIAEAKAHVARHALFLADAERPGAAEEDRIQLARRLARRLLESEALTDAEIIGEVAAAMSEELGDAYARARETAARLQETVDALRGVATAPQEFMLLDAMEAGHGSWVAIGRRYGWKSGHAATVWRRLRGKAEAAGVLPPERLQGETHDQASEAA